MRIVWQTPCFREFGKAVFCGEMKPKKNFSFFEFFA